MQSFSDHGLILKRKNFGESDKLITLFTKRNGKIKVVAKGVRKITSRRAGSLELLNFSKVSFQQTKSLPILTEAESQNTFPALKNDLNKLSVAFLVLELVDRLFDEGQENSLIFNLLIDTISRIDQAVSLVEAKKFQTSFQIKLLTQVGYLPELYNCARCENKLVEAKTFLSPTTGGLVDAACNRETLLSKTMSPDEVKLLRFLNNENFSFVERLNLSANLLNQTSELLNYYTVYFLERDLNSVSFADQLQRLYLPT